MGGNVMGNSIELPAQIAAAALLFAVSLKTLKDSTSADLPTVDMSRIGLDAEGGDAGGETPAAADVATRTP